MFKPKAYIHLNISTSTAIFEQPCNKTWISLLPFPQSFVVSTYTHIFNQSTYSLHAKENQQLCRYISCQAKGCLLNVPDTRNTYKYSIESLIIAHPHTHTDASTSYHTVSFTSNRFSHLVIQPLTDNTPPLALHKRT